MGISQTTENNGVISSKAKRKNERDVLNEEISVIINHIYGTDSYKNMFSKLELNQIVRYYGEIKKIVNPDDDAQYNTSYIKEFLKKKRNTFVYQKVTPTVKSKKEKQKELEIKRNEEKKKSDRLKKQKELEIKRNEEKKKSDRLKNQKQVKLRFERKLRFELTLRECNTIIAEIKPDTPFNINKKDVNSFCQRIKSLKKRYGEDHSLRELFDLEKKGTVNHRGKDKKIVRKYRYNPNRTHKLEEKRRKLYELRIESELKKKQNYWGSNY